MARTQKNTPAAATAGFISDFPQIDAADLFNAYCTVAYFFVIPETGKDGTQVNALAYQQKAVLGGICYSLNNQIEGSLKYKGLTAQLKDARDQVIAHLQEFNGTEIWTRQLRQKEAWVVGKENELHHHTEALRQAKRAYEKFVGHAWDQPPTTAQAETKVVESDVHAIAAKYGKTLNTAMTTGTGGEQLSHKGQ